MEKVDKFLHKNIIEKITWMNICIFMTSVVAYCWKSHCY